MNIPKDFLELKRNLKKDYSGLKRIRLAVLGDSSTQFLVQALRGTGFDRGFNLEIWEADFSQIERQIFDPSSEFYSFNPEIVLLFFSSHKLLGKYNKQKPGSHQAFESSELSKIENLYSTIQDRLGAKVICYNFTEIDDSVFGNYSNKRQESFVFQLRKLNYELMVFASENANLFLCDLSTIQNQTGKAELFHPSIYINTEMVLSIDSLPLVAGRTLDIIGAIQGTAMKCLILDLDNTMWGGIIGDDGLENIQIGTLGIGKAFTELQHWVKKLRNRGVIIAVCSKNTESVAKEPFEKHPDMVIQLDDIAVFVANWENKADNIRHIQSILNIGFDSMVFLDDNPFERNMVRQHIPGICVPELPEDPAEYLEFLYTLNLFETVSFSEEDLQRTRQYQEDAKRSDLKQAFADEDAFLKNLEMHSMVEPFNKFNGPRVAQLSQRSNQFNLRTVRYSEADIARMATDEQHLTFTFTLEDKFGDNGLICVLIMKKESSEMLFIDTWFMSCRVLKRGMENFVLNTIVDFASRNGYQQIKGEYIATSKNGMVKDHYAHLGFQPSSDYWLLDIPAYVNKKTHIKKVNYGTK